MDPDARAAHRAGFVLVELAAGAAIVGVLAVAARYSPGRSSVTTHCSAPPRPVTSMPAGAANRMSSPAPAVASSVGVPDAKSGEAVKLFVVKKDPALTAEALIAHCREQLTGYKCPRDVEFRTELPKSNVGKILRRELRDEARKNAA